MDVAIPAAFSADLRAEGLVPPDSLHRTQTSLSTSMTRLSTG